MKKRIFAFLLAYIIVFSLIPIASVRTSADTGSWDMSLPSLAERYEPYFLIGNIWTDAQRMSDSSTQRFYLNQYNTVTAENSMKPDTIVGTPNGHRTATPPGLSHWNFSTADNIVNWAEQNDLTMIGHTLV